MTNRTHNKSTAKPSPRFVGFEVADPARVIAWARSSDRKPSQLAFTSGPERQAAYWIEWAWANIPNMKAEAPK